MFSVFWENGVFLHMCIASGLTLFWGKRNIFWCGYYLHIIQFNLASSHYLVYATPTAADEQIHLWETMFQKNQMQYPQQKFIVFFTSYSSSA